jgi:hypothetical protein
MSRDIGHSDPISQSGKTGLSDTVLLEKIRWSFRQRFRKQVHLLLGEFFEQVDDYFFVTGQKGELCSEAECLNTMRQIRSRQSSFQERLLDAAIANMKLSYRADVIGLPGVSSDSELSDSSFPDDVMEEVEIDLALHAAQRKSIKHHQAVMQRLRAVQSGEGGGKAVFVIDPEVILQSVDVGFCKAQFLLTMPLELRLLFIKLFERHVMLRLERIYTDLISIIRNASDPEFIARLYSSSSAFQRRGNTSAGAADKTVLQHNHSASRAAPVSNLSTAHVRQSVDSLVSGLCANRRLPPFLDQFVKQQWREILFLTGMRQGTTGVEWGEVRHMMSLLVTTVDQGLPLDGADFTHLKTHLQHGFALIQWPGKKQRQFLAELEQLFVAGRSISKSDHADRRVSPDTLEKSISPAGEHLLDQEDLDEIAKLLGGSAGHTDSHLQELLTQVDALPDHTTIEFQLAGEYVQCLMLRKTEPSLQFLISKHGAGISITRSRLGVALSLQSGEMRLAEPLAGGSLDSKTVLITANKYRH